MTASAQLDGRIDYKGTFANLVATVPIAGMPVGTLVYTTDMGRVTWTGTYWELFPALDGIVASATQTQAAGTLLGASMCRVATVATAGNAVTLPVSFPSLDITVTNAGANSLNIFPAVGDTINSLGANAAYALAAGKTVNFLCYTAGQLHTLLSA